MKQLRQFAINGLSLITRPFFQGAAIICLHRVLPEEEKSPLSIPRDLEISLHFLEAIVNVMREEGYQFLPLDKVLETVQKTPRTRYCALTFDDGYRDNLTYAYPVLAALDVPFTIYVTSGFINGSLEPWWYRLQRLLTGPGPLRVPSPSGPFPIALETKDSRERHYLEIYQSLKTLPAEERENRLSEIADINSEALISAEPVPFLSDSELNLLAKSGLANIAAHTVTHPNLTLLDPAVVEREMRESKETIEAWIERPVFDFSYPHGLSNPGIAQIAKKAGFRSATTTHSKMIRERTVDLYALPRLCFGGEQEDRTILVRTVRGVYAKCSRKA